MAGTKLKLVIYGIDSADWAVLDPLLASGELPNLRQVLDEGSRAVLRSTIPPITAVAWPTAFTGTNPGRHGLFGFVLTGQRPTLLSNADRRQPALWQILSGAGMTVGCFLVPFTCPADAVKGWMLSGASGTAWRAGSTHPPELFDELEPLLRQYPAEVLSPSISKAPGALEAAWQRLSDWRAKLLEHLLSSRPVDVLLAVDNATDVLQHKFLVARRLDQGQDMVAWAYKHADRMLGLIRQYTDAETKFLLLSDHGAQPLAGYIDVAAWLSQQGYLRYRTGGPVSALRGAALNMARKLARRLLGVRARQRLVGVGHALTLSQLIDWPNTRAFAWPGGGIIVNVPGRSRHPTVAEQDRERLAQEIAQGLRELHNPLSGRTDIEAYLREELYEGPYVSQAPDVVVVPQGFALDIISTAPRSDRVFWTAEDLRRAGLGYKVVREGTHRREGILAVSPAPEGGLPEVTDLVNVAPTALAMLGLPIPAGMDGRSLLGGQQEASESTQLQPSAPKDVYTPEEEEQIARRLADLGYL